MMPADVSGNDADPALRLVARYVDTDLYVRRNADVAAAGVDAAAHYWHSGWREGRDPNDWFQTGYYLRSNPDVAEAGVNPLWHYLAHGRREGRLPRPPTAYWRDALAAATPPRERLVRRAADLLPLRPAALRRLLAAACAGARGLVVALGHDRYPDVPGGTQRLIADEQRKFNGDNAAYLHLSPMTPRLGLAPPVPEPNEWALILDGVARGMADATAVTQALAGVTPGLRRLLVVHALHGHRPEAVAALATALRPAHALFWVHDYGAACGSPRLLRNDIAFCAAPPPDSMGCRVCVYGDERPQHTRRLAALFAAVPFDVAAPSPTALGLWQRATGLRVRSACVHPHARLAPLPAAAARDTPPDPAEPARVAFVGHAVFHKGWELFADLVAASRHSGAYQFFHIASPAELRPLDGVTPVAAGNDEKNPFGMVRALAAHRIDLVLALSPWPETFGYVAHEALAAGADIVALEGGGNIADLVRRRAAGVVVPDAAALTAFFTSGRASDHVRRQRAGGRQRSALLHHGSTATLAFDATEPTTRDPDLHLRLGSIRLDGREAGDTWHFALPPPRAGDGNTLRLRSRHLDGAWEDAWGEERRQLGVAVMGLTCDGVAIPRGDRRLGAGWHKPETAWQWTNGDAVVQAGGARSLHVSIMRRLCYWRAPLLAAP